MEKGNNWKTSPRGVGDDEPISMNTIARKAGNLLNIDMDTSISCDSLFAGVGGDGDRYEGDKDISLDSILPDMGLRSKGKSIEEQNMDNDNVVVEEHENRNQRNIDGVNKVVPKDTDTSYENKRIKGVSRRREEATSCEANVATQKTFRKELIGNEVILSGRVKHTQKENVDFLKSESVISRTPIDIFTRKSGLDNESVEGAVTKEDNENSCVQPQKPRNTVLENKNKISTQSSGPFSITTMAKDARDFLDTDLDSSISCDSMLTGLAMETQNTKKDEFSLDSLLPDSMIEAELLQKRKRAADTSGLLREKEGSMQKEKLCASSSHPVATKEVKESINSASNEGIPLEHTDNKKQDEYQRKVNRKYVEKKNVNAKSVSTDCRGNSYSVTILAREASKHLNLDMNASVSCDSMLEEMAVGGIKRAEISLDSLLEEPSERTRENYQTGAMEDLKWNETNQLKTSQLDEASLHIDKTKAKTVHKHDTDSSETTDEERKDEVEGASDLQKPWLNTGISTSKQPNFIEKPSAVDSIGTKELKENVVEGTYTTPQVLGYIKSKEKIPNVPEKTSRVYSKYSKTNEETPDKQRKNTSCLDDSSGTLISLNTLAGEAGRYLKMDMDSSISCDSLMVGLTETGQSGARNDDPSLDSLLVDDENMSKNRQGKYMPKGTFGRQEKINSGKTEPLTTPILEEEVSNGRKTEQEKTLPGSFKQTRTTPGPFYQQPMSQQRGKTNSASSTESKNGLGGKDAELPVVAVKEHEATPYHPSKFVSINTIAGEAGKWLGVPMDTHVSFDSLLVDIDMSEAGGTNTTGPSLDSMIPTCEKENNMDLRGVDGSFQTKDKVKCVPTKLVTTEEKNTDLEYSTFNEQTTCPAKDLITGNVLHLQDNSGKAINDSPEKLGKRGKETKRNTSETKKSADIQSKDVNIRTELGLTSHGFQDYLSINTIAGDAQKWLNLDMNATISCDSMLEKIDDSPESPSLESMIPSFAKKSDECLHNTDNTFSSQAVISNKRMVSFKEENAETDAKCSRQVSDGKEKKEKKLRTSIPAQKTANKIGNEVSERTIQTEETKDNAIEKQSNTHSVPTSIATESGSAHSDPTNSISINTIAGEASDWLKVNMDGSISCDSFLEEANLNATSPLLDSMLPDFAKDVKRRLPEHKCQTKGTSTNAPKQITVARTEEHHGANENSPGEKACPISQREEEETNVGNGLSTLNFAHESPVDPPSRFKVGCIETKDNSVERQKDRKDVSMHSHIRPMPETSSFSDYISINTIAGDAQKWLNLDMNASISCDSLLEKIDENPGSPSLESMIPSFAKESDEYCRNKDSIFHTQELLPVKRMFLISEEENAGTGDKSYEQDGKATEKTTTIVQKTANKTENKFPGKRSQNEETKGSAKEKRSDSHDVQTNSGTESGLMHTAVAITKENHGANGNIPSFREEEKETNIEKGLSTLGYVGASPVDPPTQLNVRCTTPKNNSFGRQREKNDVPARSNIEPMPPTSGLPDYISINTIAGEAQKWLNVDLDASISCESLLREANVSGANPSLDSMLPSVARDNIGRLSDTNNAKALRENQGTANEVSKIRFQRTGTFSARAERSQNNTGKTDMLSCEIRGSVFLRDGMLILADRKNSSLKSFDTSFDLVHCVALKDKPFDVTLAADSTVVATLPWSQGMQFVDVGSAGNMKKLNYVGTECCRFFGIHCNRTHNHLITTCSFHKGIHICNQDGEILQKIPARSKQMPTAELFKAPLYVTSDNDGKRFYVTDDEESVICLDMQGKVLWKYSGPRIKGPTGIEFRENQIMVCGNQSHVIRIMDAQTGCIAPNILGSGELSQPQTICIDNSGERMVVTPCEGNTFSVYDFSRF